MKKDTQQYYSELLFNTNDNRHIYSDQYKVILSILYRYIPDSMLTSGQRRHIRRPDDGCRRRPNGFLTGGPTLAQRRQATEKNYSLYSINQSNCPQITFSV